MAQRQFHVMKNPQTGETAVRLGKGADVIVVPWKIENDWLKLGLRSEKTVVNPNVKSLEFPYGTWLQDDEELFSRNTCTVAGVNGEAKQEDYLLYPYPEIIMNTVTLVTRSMNNKPVDRNLSWLTVPDLRKSVTEGRIFSGVSLMAYAHLEASGFLIRGIYEGDFNEQPHD